MRTYLDCVPCFLRQALDASRRVSSEASVHERVLRTTLQLTLEMPFDRPPPWMGQQIHRVLREATGDPDPYRQAKEFSNALALSLYPELKERVRASADPFATAVLLAIAGNVIDLARQSQISEDDVRRSIKRAMEGPADGAVMDEFRQAIREAHDILYLADNAGEVVFDRLLIEEMPADRVTLVVRGHPVINDATRADAEAAGLTSLVSVTDNGSDAPGTILETCSGDFRTRFERSDLVIAKGQGNYETLSKDSRDIFFLLKVKCPVVGRHVGCDVGQSLLFHNHRKRDRTKSTLPISGLEKPDSLGDCAGGSRSRQGVE